MSTETQAEEQTDPARHVRKDRAVSHECKAPRCCGLDRGGPVLMARKIMRNGKHVATEYSESEYKARQKARKKKKKLPKVKWGRPIKV